MTAERIFSDHRSHALGQAIESAAHVGSFGRQPDSRALRHVQRPQAGRLVTCAPLRHPHGTEVSGVKARFHHDATSATKPDFNRPSGNLLACLHDHGRRQTARGASLNRFFQANKYDAHRPRSRRTPLRSARSFSARPQSAATSPRLSPALSHVPNCTFQRPFTRWGQIALTSCGFPRDC